MPPFFSGWAKMARGERDDPCAKRLDRVLPSAGEDQVAERASSVSLFGSSESDDRFDERRPPAN